MSHAEIIQRLAKVAREPVNGEPVIEDDLRNVAVLVYHLPEPLARFCAQNAMRVCAAGRDAMSAGQPRQGPSEPVRRPRGPRLGVWPVLALLGALASSVCAGDVTVQEAYPGSRLRPGSDANPYELRQGGRTIGRLEETSPPTRWLVPGSESNPYRVRPRQDAADGFDGFGALDDEKGGE